MIAVLLRFRSFLRPHRLRLGGGAFFTLATALLTLLQPWPLKVIVDNVLKGKPVDVPGLTFIDGLSTNGLLYAAIVAFVAIYVLGALSDYLATWLMDSTGVRLVADIRETLFARLQRLSLRFHSRQRSGDLMARLMSDTNRMQDMLVQSFSVLIPNVVLLVGITVVMFLIDWVFTLVALAVSPLLFLIVFSYTTRIKAASRRARRREGRLAARSGEVLGAVRVVQAFTQEDYEDRRFSRRSARVAAANLEATRLQAQFSPLVDILTGVGTALVLLVGTRRVLSGELTLGLLLVFLSYLRSLYRPMRQLSKLSYVSSKGFASAERISEILEAERDVDDVPDAPAAPRLRGEVRFDAVEFGYGERPVLSDIDLVVSPGEVIAIVGPTGAGKSTLVSLIPRFFDPARGRVLVDGVDVRSVQLQSLRSQIAIVLQEPILFEGTITQNIAYGRPAASEAEVLRAAEAALVDEFVAGLPDGYDTVVGERGATLSGGERQRISIARALVREAPILILDEPTSALDLASERLVVEALANLLQACTTFVIAHRMSTVAGADRVVVLDGGRVLEVGSHEELLAHDEGLYRRFLELQIGSVAASRTHVVGTDARAGAGRRRNGMFSDPRR